MQYYSMSEKDDSSEQNTPIVKEQTCLEKIKNFLSDHSDEIYQIGGMLGIVSLVFVGGLCGSKLQKMQDTIEFQDAILNAIGKS